MSKITIDKKIVKFAVVKDDTQSNAAAAEESAAAVAELNSQSEKLKLVVAQISRLVGGGKGGVGSPRALID